MEKKLYVGNLSYNVTDDQLKTTFEQAGSVESANVIIDRQTNRSKGFGFVQMATEEDAKAAIDMYDGKEMDGRPLRVSEARPMTDRPRKRF
ncbi:MAG: RNA-binding protein [Patescibacteria group bacterium]|jgi:RNA recognition motif-containing protein